MICQAVEDNGLNFSGARDFGKLEQTGTNWNKLEQTGTNWNKLEQSGTKWNKLEQDPDRATEEGPR